MYLSLVLHGLNELSIFYDKYNCIVVHQARKKKKFELEN